MTDAEVILWSKLRSWPELRFRRQHPIGPYIADFVCVPAKLVIEVDGATHGSNAERMHDNVRDKYLQMRGWRVLRIWNSDLYERLPDVLDMIDVRAPLHRFAVPLPRRRGRKGIERCLVAILTSGRIVR